MRSVQSTPLFDLVKLPSSLIRYNKSLRLFIILCPPPADVTDGLPCVLFFAGVPGKCLSTIKEEDQFYGLDYRKDGSVFAATGKNHTVRSSTETVGASSGLRGDRVVLRAKKNAGGVHISLRIYRSSADKRVPHQMPLNMLVSAALCLFVLLAADSPGRAHRRECSRCTYYVWF